MCDKKLNCVPLPEPNSLLLPSFPQSSKQTRTFSAGGKQCVVINKCSSPKTHFHLSPTKPREETLSSTQHGANSAFPNEMSGRSPTRSGRGRGHPSGRKPCQVDLEHPASGRPGAPHRHCSGVQPKLVPGTRPSAGSSPAS